MINFGYKTVTQSASFLNKKMGRKVSSFLYQGSLPDRKSVVADMLH